MIRSLVWFPLRRLFLRFIRDAVRISTSFLLWQNSIALYGLISSSLPIHSSVIWAISTFSGYFE